MAIGPVGSAIFANQMTATVSSVQNAHDSRVNFQNMVAQAVINETDEKVLEVRPAEENHEVDEDKEHQRDEAERELQRSEKEEDSEDETVKNIHVLDIKV